MVRNSGTDRLRAHPTLWKTLRGALPLIAALHFLYALLGRLDGGRYSESASRDLMTRLSAVFSGPRTAPDLAVVMIGDADYATLFRASSPLDPVQLQRLLDAVGRGGPAVIGVDIDTSDPRMAGLRAPEGVPTVWAVPSVTGCRCDPDHECGAGLAGLGRERAKGLTYCDRAVPSSEPVEVPLGHIGGASLEPAGMASLDRDGDGMIRRYRAFRTVASGGAPTFAAQVARYTTARRASGDVQLDSVARFIRYRPQRALWQRSASEVILAAASNPDYDMFRGKVVLIGGSYWASRDHHLTPLGEHAGVTIHAQIIETMLEGGGPPPVRRVLLYAALLLCSYAILVFFHFYPPSLAFRRTVVAVFLLSMLGSLVAARDPLALLPIFALLLGGVLVGVMYGMLASRHKETVYGLAGAALGRKSVDASYQPAEVGPAIERRARRRLLVAARRLRRLLQRHGAVKHAPKTPTSQ